MRVVKQTDRYVILDDVLPPEQFDLMLEYAARNDYARNPRWIKPWDLGDEMPWQTGETVYTRGKPLHAQDPRKAYPTGMAVDLLLKKIMDSKFYRDHVPDTYVTARTYLHPPGSGLGLARRRGALRRCLHLLRAPTLARLVGRRTDDRGRRPRTVAAARQATHA
jgi:hypothetical protein